jgi:hypothetical protein
MLVFVEEMSSFKFAQIKQGRLQWNEQNTKWFGMSELEATHFLNEN